MEMHAVTYHSIVLPLQNPILHLDPSELHPVLAHRRVDTPARSQLDLQSPAANDLHGSGTVKVVVPGGCAQPNGCFPPVVFVAGGPANAGQIVPWHWLSTVMVREAACAIVALASSPVRMSLPSMSDGVSAG